MSARAAASRVQAFIDARKRYRSLLDPRVHKPAPDRIIAQYGVLEIADLQALVDAARVPVVGPEETGALGLPEKNGQS